MLALRLQNRRLSKKLDVLNEDGVYSWLQFRIRDRLLSLRGWPIGEMMAVWLLADENGDASVSVSTYSQKRMSIKSRQERPRDCFSENAVIEE